MRFEDLSPADQALVNKDFGGLDKVAAEQVKVASEMYNAGAEMAQATADQMDKLAAEEKEEKEEKEEMGEEEKKASADYGNIIAEGFIDKLASLGEERFGNPAHYVMPYVEEKIAQVGAQAALAKFAASKGSFMASLASKGKEVGKALKGQAASAQKYVGQAGKDLKAAATGKVQVGKKVKELSAMDRLSKLKKPGMVAGGAAAAGAAGYGAKKALED